MLESELPGLGEDPELQAQLPGRDQKLGLGQAQAELLGRDQKRVQEELPELGLRPELGQAELLGRDQKLVQEELPELGLRPGLAGRLDAALVLELSLEWVPLRLLRQGPRATVRWVLLVLSRGVAAA
jgi:hypothetical protein